MMTVRQKERKKKIRWTSREIRVTSTGDFSRFNVLPETRCTTPILEVETLVAKDPRRKHDSQLMISPLDKDMETLPRQDASTPVLRQIN